jgi:hypothetical protein
MKELITHLLKSNSKEIVDKSFLNCHVKGLHSIMLIDCPEKTVRMYITDNTHKMYKNYSEPHTLSYHPHHCELTLHCVYGELTNIGMKIENEHTGNDCHYYDRWLYSSLISNGKMGFVKDGSDLLRQKSSITLGVGDMISMQASDIHTVACPKGEWSAWMVYEGKENKNYVPYAWSNSDLSKIDNKGLYKKPTKATIVELLTKVKMIK